MRLGVDAVGSLSGFVSVLGSELICLALRIERSVCLCRHRKDNKLLSNYRNIKSQDNFDVWANGQTGCYLLLGGTNFVTFRSLRLLFVFFCPCLSEVVSGEIIPDTSSYTESGSEQVVLSFGITNPVVIWFSLAFTLSCVSCKAFGVLRCLHPVTKVIPKATPITVTAFPAFRSRLS